MSLVCFGEALIDFLSDGKQPESFTKYAGGAPANVSVAAAKLGLKTSFCGMLGDDMFGHFIKDELTQHGVNTQYCQFTDAAKTALAFVSLDESGERSFSFYRPPAADLLLRGLYIPSDDVRRCVLCLDPYCNRHRGPVRPGEAANWCGECRVRQWRATHDGASSWCPLGRTVAVRPSGDAAPPLRT